MSFRRLVCIVVKYLQDGFTKIQTHASFGFVTLARPSNHKTDISHVDRVGSIGRRAMFGFVTLGQKNHKTDTSHIYRFGSVGRRAISFVCFVNPSCKLQNTIQNKSIKPFYRNALPCHLAMCWFSWDATIFCDKFMLPKRRFWTAEQ